MAKSDGTVYIDTRMDTNGFGKGVNTMQKQIGGLSGAIGKLGAVITATFAVGKLIQFGKEAINLGSDLSEVQNVVDVTFTTMNEQINEFAKNAAETAGLSETMAKRYTGTFGAMAKAFGFAEAESFNMSTSLTQLAGDVASFYNLTQDEAYTKLKSVFTGETESLKDLGVVMTQAALDSFAMAKGYGKTTKQMSEQEKVALRYAFVLDQLSSASGDFVRTQDSWANQTRILSLNFDSFKANIGQALINIFTPFLKVINQIVAKMAQLSERFVAFSEMLVGKSTSGGGGSPGEALAEIENGYENIANATKEATKAQNNYMTGLDEIKTFQSLQGTESGVGSGISAISPDETEKANENLSKTESLIDKVINKITDLIKNKDWEGLGSYISDGIVGAFNFLGDKIEEFDWEGFGEDVGGFIKGIKWGEILKSVGVLIWDGINGGIDFWKGMFDTAPIETTIISGLAILKFTGLGNVLKNAFKTSMLGAFTSFGGLGGLLTMDLSTILGAGTLTEIGLAAGTAIIGGILAAIIGFNIGKEIGKVINPEGADFYENFKWLGKDGFFAQITEDWKVSLDALLDMLTDFENNPIIAALGQAIAGPFISAIANIKKAFEKIYPFLQEWFAKIKPWFTKEKWSEAMKGIKSAFENIWKGAVNIAIKLLNKFIDYINEKMHFEWEPFEVLGQEVIPGGSVQLFTIPKIPMLATGAVIPPNAPFMAMLGDQKHGTNIEAPLDTIKQAVREVVGNNGGGKYAFTAQINRRTLFEEIIDEAKLRQSTSGRNPFDLA